MKKFAVLVAALALAAFSAPVWAMTNPFMDVPMNHWAYDAIGQLAAHGILAGYPDGTYKGQQQTTRYELASSLARSLAVVDMTKASKQDVEMMKRLVVEFRDELEALGVRVDELDERVQVLEDRLGGWHIHGELRLDLNHTGAKLEDDAGTPRGESVVSRARLFFERRFGEAEEMKFVARIQHEGSAGSASFTRFYAEMPFFYDSTLTVGKFLWEFERPYYMGGDTSVPETGGFVGLDDVLTDRTVQGLGITKNFGLGTFRVYVSHGDIDDDALKEHGASRVEDERKSKYGWDKINFSAWEVAALAQFQFTEQFGFDIGGVAFKGDNAEYTYTTDYTDTETSTTYEDKVMNGLAFAHSWTLFGGLRFNWNENIALKGIFYHQDNKIEAVVQTDDGWDPYTNNTYVWRDVYSGTESKNDPNHWAVIIDIAQPALKFTSLWLEYGQYDENFYSPTGLNDGCAIFASKVLFPSSVLPGKLKYFRVVLGQQWNETWGTHLFYYGYDMDHSRFEGDTDVSTYGNAKMSEIGVGVQYRLNPATTMGLNYVHAEDDGYNNSFATTPSNEKKQDDVVRFRTEVTF